MNDSRGSAIVLAMLLLVLLSAIGMYLIALPFPAGRTRPNHELETVARNMAKAGAHAAIARLPETIPPDSPHVRQFSLRRNITGKYAASSGRSAVRNPRDRNLDVAVEEFTVLSEGGVVETGDVKHRVRAVILYSAREGRGRITHWEDTASP